MAQHQNSFADLLQLEAMTDSFSDLSVVSDADLRSSTKDDITVFVSGRTFFMLPSLFEQVKSLPWYQAGGFYHLDAEPDVFEIILQYFLVGSLPSKALVKKWKKEALMKLLSLLGEDAEELRSCVIQGGCSRKDHSISPLSIKMGFSLRSSTNKRNSTSCSVRSSPKKAFNSPFKNLTRKVETSPTDFVKLSNALLDDLDDSGSETVASTISDVSQKENLKAKKKWGFSGKPSTQEVHQSWCESEYIV